ncbi:swr1 complex component [Pichia californica]|uniref:Helicase SWR1 n=1 Tax=Pichia californica TaxID=460514 RepID=A0A9P6WP71_9ASCO|nr:swr1 complex component [[Candida] californica]KAG0690744.1 swr1 complex component [[Candida] californica]
MSETISSTEKTLLNLLTESDILIDELYHLLNFQSITNYNPTPENIILNKDSQSFINFKNDLNLDIWPQPNKRLTRRISIDQNNEQTKLKNKLLDHLNSNIIETLELSSFNDNINLNNISSRKRRISNLNFSSQYPKKSKLSKNINLKLSVKPQIISHPEHIPTHEFNSIKELFDSYRNIIEDPAPEIENKDFNEYLNNQTELINKIKEAINNKHLLYIDFNENPFRNVPSGMREPTMIKRNQNYHLNHYKPAEIPFRMKNDLTHYDHLLAQGLKSSKLIHDLRTTKIQKCKRIAQMIEVHFKRLSQENEKKEREFKKKIVRLAKETAKEVKKKWLIAVKAYKILEDREKEHERAVKSKEQLSKILDHSTKVLGAQLINKPSNAGSSVEPDNIDLSYSSGKEDSDDEMLSSSESENDEVDDKKRVQITNEDDNKLSVDELKEKYKDLTFSNNKTEENLDSNNSHLVNKLENVKAKTTMETTTRDNSILSDDYSDSLSDSGSESDSSNNESNDESTPGLKYLFTTKNITNSDDDDESVYSEKELNETPTSSPEHIEETNDDDRDDGIPDVPIPSLLKGTLRPYQKQGLNWLASLYNNGTNGILADEMGLGKTIQTISLLSYLACEKNIWGPHLIVVPTSVMLNWEMEFKRFAPGFKVLTYYGSPQQRKDKRKGWNTPDTFHICITSYQLVVHDQPIFRRKKWKYMILDEAHNIKNFRSQRWKALLNFNTEHRILLTGTPLQNNIMELWSLLYFLMPSSKEGNVSMPEGFADLMDFQQWFGKPVDKIIQQGGEDHETRETVHKLHQVLRPYLLRRLKQDVEKQMPAKHEHVVSCRLSKRQRLLYDDFMSRAQTKETLASGNFLSIINCLMQLRKVCNHPDLFEVRPILTSFTQEKSVASNFELKNQIVGNYLKVDSKNNVNLQFLNLVSSFNSLQTSTSYHLKTIQNISASNIFQSKIEELETKIQGKAIVPNFDDLEIYYEYILNKENKDLLEMMKHRKYVNDFNCNKSQLISFSLIDMLTLKKSKHQIAQLKGLKLIKSVTSRSLLMKDTIEKYAFITPKVICSNMNDLMYSSNIQREFIYDSQNDIIENPFHQVQVKTSIAFPDKSLLQYDCGKLQKLAQLLHDLIPQGHRVLIFTQMSKVLDILELFLNYHGYTYMRLDGATKIEDRQLLTESFNNDSRVKCFILSTRAGGLGINLTGADTVIFYDSDWNPAIDKQCQDRCHRIGQTRDVHIYRFVSEYTIEANILKKAEQKKHLDNVVIQDGDFTTDYFNKVTVRELLGKPNDDIDIDIDGNEDETEKENQLGKGQDFAKALEMAEDVEDAKAAEIAMRESNVDIEDFSDDEKNNKNNNSIDTRNLSVASNNNETTPEVVEVETLARRISENRTCKELITKNNDQLTEVKSAPINEDENNYVEYEDDYDDGIGHIDEYMIRFIAGGYYFD